MPEVPVELPPPIEAFESLDRITELHGVSQLACSPVQMGTNMNFSGVPNQHQSFHPNSPLLCKELFWGYFRHWDEPRNGKPAQFLQQLFPPCMQIPAHGTSV